MAVLRRSFASTPEHSAASAAAGSTSATANSYINLGTFETMGSDPGRMAMGINYLEEQSQLLEGEHAAETDPRKKSAKAIGAAQSRMQVGRQHHQQQDANEAISHYKHALDLVQESIRARRDEDDPASKKAVTYASFLMSEILCALGVAFNDVGRTDEALQMLDKALQLRKAMVGKDHPSIAECMNNLGAIYFGRQAYQKSAEYYEQALELLTNASGSEEGPYIGLCYYNIGLCRGHLGEGPAAFQALRKALTIAENALGKDHPQVRLIQDTIDEAKRSASEAPKPPGDESQAKPDQ